MCEVQCSFNQKCLIGLTECCVIVLCRRQCVKTRMVGVFRTFRRNVGQFSLPTSKNSLPRTDHQQQFHSSSNNNNRRQQKVIGQYYVHYFDGPRRCNILMPLHFKINVLERYKQVNNLCYKSYYNKRTCIYTYDT